MPAKSQSPSLIHRIAILDHASIQPPASASSSLRPDSWPITAMHFPSFFDILLCSAVRTQPITAIDSNPGLLCSFSCPSLRDRDPNDHGSDPSAASGPGVCKSPALLMTASPRAAEAAQVPDRIQIAIHASSTGALMGTLDLKQLLETKMAGKLISTVPLVDCPHAAGTNPMRLCAFERLGQSKAKKWRETIKLPDQNNRKLGEFLVQMLKQAGSCFIDLR